MLVTESMLEIPTNVRATGPDPSRASTEFCPFDPSFRVDQFKNKNLEKLELDVGEKEITTVQDSVVASGVGERGHVSDKIVNGVDVVVKMELI